jgi:hypothetical protein
MKVYRKSLIVQMLLFFAFLLMGGNVIFSHFVPTEEFEWFYLIFLASFVLFGVVGFLIYKSPSQKVCNITQKQISRIRYLLYGYFFVYIAQLVLINFEFFQVNVARQTILYVSSGSLLMLIALYGLYYQYSIISIKKGDL